MPTLASMFGAIEYPVQQRANDEMTVAMRELDRPHIMGVIDGEMALELKQIELQKGILMQSAIGK